MSGAAANDLTRLAGSTVVVTGANRGVGFAAAREFAKAGARVVLACRDTSSAWQASTILAEQAPGALVEVVELDLASLESVRACAAALRTHYQRIHVLCNNAGIMVPPRRASTEDGYELQFGVNHLGHFALTGLLLDLLTGARVVTVTSIGHWSIGGLDFTDLQQTRRYRRFTAYFGSKLANLLFAYELDRRARAHELDLVSVACHPGMAKSNLLFGAHRAAGVEPSWYLRLADRLTQSGGKGATPMIRAAVDEQVRGGELFGPSSVLQTRGRPEMVSSSRASHDEEAARHLWRVSEDLSGVRYLS